MTRRQSGEDMNGKQPSRGNSKCKGPEAERASVARGTVVGVWGGRTVMSDGARAPR